MTETANVIARPLDARMEAAFAPDGRYKLQFHSAMEAKSWAKRFFWAKARLKREISKENKKIMTTKGNNLTASDIDWITQRSEESNKLDEFQVYREGTTVTVMSLHVNSGLVAINDVPLKEKE